MSNNPASARMKVSIIIPTFNRCELLRQTLESVFAQNAPIEEVEVIVVIDGSRDDSAAMLRSIHSPCKLRFIEQENRGQAAAKNAGIKLCGRRAVALLG